MANNIFIFSRPIRTGKTTELMDWITGKDKVGGFLTPDTDGIRMLYDIKAKKYYAMQLPAESEEQSISVGKFSFSKKAFERAKHLLSDTSADWLIIDEAGKLEIEQGTGLEPELSDTINFFKRNDSAGTLILVIRDTLIEKAIKKYDLGRAEIVHSLKELC
jgi:nucleoside-triphosphatase THEP1